MNPLFDINRELLGNRVELWLVALGVFAGVLAAARILQAVFARRISAKQRHERTDLYGVLLASLGRIRFPLVAVVAF
jgi:uncharacterized membrane protein